MKVIEGNHCYFLLTTNNKLGYFYVTAWSIVENSYNINFAARLLEKWLRYWQWPTKLAIEAPSWSLKFFVVLTLLLPTGGLPKKISAQLVEKWLRYWQLKVCVVGGVVGGGFQSIAWSQPQSGLAVTINRKHHKTIDTHEMFHWMTWHLKFVHLHSQRRQASLLSSWGGILRD